MNDSESAANDLTDNFLARVKAESDSDVEEDTRSSKEFLADLNLEFHDRALLANQKRFYKRSGRVGASRKPMDKSNKTWFACGKQGHFQKDSDNGQKDYRVKCKALKAELSLLTQKIEDVSKNKSKRGLVAESFDCDEESLSSKNKEVTRVKAFMAIAEDEPTIEKTDARSGQWVKITMKKVQRLISMNDGDERKHVLDYTNVDLHYVEDQRKNLLNKFNSLKQEFFTCKSELIDLKNTKVQNLSFQHEITRLTLDNESQNDKVCDLNKVIEKWTYSKVTIDQ
ncbi:hypothetical protein Tco_0424109 [Tanacetum coccineum]